MKEDKEKETINILMMIAVLILAIIVTIVYLCYFIECKNINIIPLIISSIFLLVFISLNFLLVIDYFIATEFQIDSDTLLTKILSVEFLFIFQSY